MPGSPEGGPTWADDRDHTVRHPQPRTGVPGRPGRGMASATATGTDPVPIAPRPDGARRGSPGSRGGGPAEPPDAVFSALADPTRRAILRAVAEDGPVTATSLAGRLPVSRQAVAKHLGQLREAGLVAAERAGREARFTAVAAPLDDLAAWAAATGRRWDHRLARLRRHLG